MRTYIYVDGFNLYYGAVKDTPYKWLDLKALFTRILRPENKILAIKYYTAKVSARPDDPGAPTRQTIFLDALRARIPELEIARYLPSPRRSTPCPSHSPAVASAGPSGTRSTPT